LGSGGQHSLSFAKHLSAWGIHALLGFITGVAEKVCAVFALDGLDIPVLIIDTHMARVLHRMGITSFNPGRKSRHDSGTAAVAHMYKEALATCLVEALTHDTGVAHSAPTATHSVQSVVQWQHV
jgi:hypothetical protein